MSIPVQVSSTVEASLPPVGVRSSTSASIPKSLAILSIPLQDPRVQLQGGQESSIPAMNNRIAMTSVEDKENSSVPPRTVTPTFGTGVSFVYQNNTNPSRSTSGNVLLQTLVRDNEKLKTDYIQLRRETQAKLFAQQETIHKLQESLEMNQKKLLEMKLQKEVYMARETHAFQGIHSDIQSLKEKLSLIVQSKSLASDDETSALRPEELVERLNDLESRILFLQASTHGVSTSCKAIEENLKLHMNKTDGKLDQIIHAVMTKTQNTKPNNVCQKPIELFKNTKDIMVKKASGNQVAGKFNGASTTYSKEPGFQMNRQAEILYEMPRIPLQILLNSSSSCYSGNLATNSHGAMKRKIQDNYGLLSKQVLHNQNQPGSKMEFSPMESQETDSEREWSSEEEKPPLLSLPSRIAKRGTIHAESMPVLVPEVNPVGNRKNDTLIGIKRENNSNVVHGRDFSKAGFVCVCGSRFTGAGGLYVHQVKAMENEKFSCRTCGKKFHYFSGLKAHRKSAHKQELTQEVGCSRCGQIFKSKKERQGHLDKRGQTCWLSGSYQSKDWEAIRNQRNLSSASSYSSSSCNSSQNTEIQN